MRLTLIAPTWYMDTLVLVLYDRKKTCRLGSGHIGCGRYCLAWLYLLFLKLQRPPPETSSALSH